MGKEVYPDVLADRYANEMPEIWSPRNNVRSLRTIWVRGLEIQKSLGENIPAEAIESYRRNIENIDLTSIAEREKKMRHDVMANIAEFNTLAGYELIHRGFTSRDPTDQKEQMQIRQSLELVQKRVIAVLARFGHRARLYKSIAIAGRSHMIPGQATTLGKRFANLAEELLFGFMRLNHFLDMYPIRGVKGAMGTQQDMLDLLKGKDKVVEFERMLAESLGFSRVLQSTGQIYPRSLDFAAISLLVELSSAFGNLSNMIRLMAGLDLAHEGFGQEQRGSSAMPHKVNSRTDERIRGFISLLGGYLAMVKDIAGNQWFEGDVSCSVVRRVALPGAFFAFEGMCEAALTVLDEMEVFEGAIARELEKYLPFLSTTALLMAIIKTGMGREKAHSLIRKHALDAVKAMREGHNPQLAKRLSNDPECPLSFETIVQIVSTLNHGLAEEQVDTICQTIDLIVAQNPESATYKPQPIL